MTPKEAAQIYQRLGFWVLPLHTPQPDGTCSCHKDCGKNIGKHPRTMNGLDDASNDPRAIERWWGLWPEANIGIDLARSGLVDVAPDCVDWQLDFLGFNRQERVPETLHFASGAGPGHEHHLYQRTPDCPIYRLNESGIKDVMSAGYAVAPPSLHKSGERYVWQNPSDWAGLVAPPSVSQPAWITNLLRAKQRPPTEPRSSEAGGPPVALRGEALERWYGRVFDRNVNGELDRSYSLWSLTTALLDGGLQPAYIAEVLAERDVSLGWTKFTNRGDATRRYQIIVDRAVVSQGPRRVHTGPRVRTKTRPSAPSGSLEYLTAEQIADMEDELIVWFAYGMVGGALITELDGKVKRSGKTTLILAMVRCILEGAQFLGQDTVYTPIVYLTEQSGPSFKRNLKRAGLLERNDLHILLWNKAVGRKWDEVVASARSYAGTVGAKLLVIDTLGQWSGIRGESENQSGAAMLVMEPLQAASADGLAILVSRHDRKSSGDVGESGRGSSAYAGAVDLILHLSRLDGQASVGKERQRILEGISRFEETPDKLLIELGHGEPHTYAALGDADVLRDQTIRREILANLPTNPDDAYTQDELVKKVAGRREDVLRLVKVLVREGAVRQLGSGRAGDKYRYYQLAYVEDDDDGE